MTDQIQIIKRETTREYRNLNSQGAEIIWFHDPATGKHDVIAFDWTAGQLQRNSNVSSGISDRSVRAVARWTTRAGAQRRWSRLIQRAN